MNKHYLLQKIFGLLAVVLFAISCGGVDSPGTDSVTVTATKLTSTATPSNVRDRYVVFNIRATNNMTNYRLAIAPRATSLTAADMTSTNNLGVHTYDLVGGTNSINVLMGFVYNAPILAAIQITPKRAMIFDDHTAAAQYVADVGGSGAENTSYTGPTVAGATGTGGLGAAGDVGNSLLKPNTKYVLYGLAAGSTTVTSLLSFTTDPARFNVVADGGPTPHKTFAPVDIFDDIPLEINANNYNLYPLRSYSRGKNYFPGVSYNTISIVAQGSLAVNPIVGYLIVPNSVSDYTAEMDNSTTPPTTITPASFMLLYHSMYYVQKEKISSIEFLRSPEPVVFAYFGTTNQ